MRIPNPIANTTTEAYLAYKAGVLQVGDLKPKLYFPYLHFDAWLAYWAGLTASYPAKNTGKNLCSSPWEAGNYDVTTGEKTSGSGYRTETYVEVAPNTTYIISRGGSGVAMNVLEYNAAKEFVYYKGDAVASGQSFTTSSNTKYITMYRGTSGGINEMMLEKGSTITAYEPYTGTPECLTDEEALVAYLSGVTNTYPDTVKDPEDVRIAGYLRYLVSARFGRPAYPVNNRELYLSMLKPPVVTNETPSASIVLEDTIEVKFVSMEMFGDTSQQSYTGKNLWGGFASDFSKTVADVVFVNKADGTITANGTATGTALSLFGSDAVSQNRLITLSAGNYIISGATDTVGLEVIDTSGGVVADTSGSISGVKAFSISDPMQVAVRAKMGNTAVADNVTLKPMLETGSTATPYEPYVGGVPAPNPNYPQKVQTVTGEQEIFITGKNLLDSSQYTAEGDGLTNKLNADGTITTTGIPTKNYARLISDTDITDMLEDGQTYTCSETEGAPAHVVTVQVRALKRAGGYDYYPNSFTVDKTTHESYQVAVQAGTMEQWGSESRTFTCGYQLEKGSEATDFEPYRGRQQYIINLNGKNLFDKANANTFAGTVGTSVINPGGANKILYVPCLPEETYTVQKRNDGNTNRFAVATTHDLPEGGVAVTGMIQQNNASSITITTAVNARYLVIMYYRTQETAVTEQQVLDSIQIEEGSIATSYAPYSTPIELCKISWGDYIAQDYIYKDGQQWYIHKEVNKIILNGDSLWSIANSGTAKYWYNSTNTAPGTYGNPDNARWLLSNYGVGDQVTSSNTRQGIFILGSGNVRVRYGSEISLSDWKAKLNSKNMTLYYAIATPTDTEITNPTLIAQLDALADGNSYDTTTYITVTSTGDNLPGLLKVEAGTESIS